jgi:carboxymethylenebutenolidase
MSATRIDFDTPDGRCPAWLFTPADGRGPWPGMLLCMDGPGMRPVLHEMAQRLADAGYTVLLPDFYYRHGAYAPMDPAVVFSDPQRREKLLAWVHGLSRQDRISDVSAAIDVLAARAESNGQRPGIVGYCMGGNMALTAAGALPDRFAVIASFHGGGLATDAQDSPHRHLQGIDGRVYVAGAEQDSSFTDAQKQQLEQALLDAGVDHRVETYAGAHHGFAVPDHPAFNSAAAERHWQELFALLREELDG